MSDLAELIEEWREFAEDIDTETGQKKQQKFTLIECADQLEQVIDDE